MSTTLNSLINLLCSQSMIGSNSRMKSDLMIMSSTRTLATKRQQNSSSKENRISLTCTNWQPTLFVLSSLKSFYISFSCMKSSYPKVTESGSSTLKYSIPTISKLNRQKFKKLFNGWNQSTESTKKDQLKVKKSNDAFFFNLLCICLLILHAFR